MIVSYKHNFIFIKTRKTAGTSMEIALATLCGPEDTITPLATEDEFVRLELDPGSLPRNYLKDPAAEERYRDVVRRGDHRAMKKFRKEVFEEQYVLYNHASAKRAVKVLAESVWKNAYKFTIERHPYEKAVSMAWFRLGGGDFPAVLADTVDRGKYKNYDLYTLDGVVAADFIIRYEHLVEDLKLVETKLGGLEIVSHFPATKSNYRGERTPATELLSPAQKSVIQKTCAEEFELMGYQE